MYMVTVTYIDDSVDMISLIDKTSIGNHLIQLAGVLTKYSKGREVKEINIKAFGDD